MKRLLLSLSLFAGMVALAVAQDKKDGDTPDGLVEEMLKQMDNISKDLALVRDMKSLNENKSKLEASMKALASIQERGKKLPDLTPETKKQYESKHKGRIDGAMVKMREELTRIARIKKEKDGDPDGSAIMAELGKILGATGAVPPPMKKDEPKKDPPKKDEPKKEEPKKEEPKKK